MVLLENPLFWLVLGILSLIFLIGSQLFFTRGLIHHANLKFQELDENLGQIITEIIENNPIMGDSENQITPIQAFFMDIVKQKMNPAIKVTEITQSRDDQGKFA